jgi:HlyD family secretion protein
MRFAYRGPWVPAALAATVAAGCGRGDQPDAYGNFETTEVTVSAEAAGRLLWFTPDDGQRVEAGVLVGVIDTIQLALERAHAVTQRDAGNARSREATQQIAMLRTQREIAERGYARTQRLHRDQAATAQQLDQAERDFRVLGEQIAAAEAQYQAVRHDVASGDARIAQIDERISRSRITNPRPGTVLTTYAEAGEYVQPGQPLYKVAMLDSLELRAWVTERQLAGLRIGQAAEVTIDLSAGERRTLAGTVTWIAAESEFTPTPVQTREERADLVYAVKVVVPNPDGVLKIGMPADVRFTAADSAAAHR